jgi:hypothetical protein
MRLFLALLLLTFAVNARAAGVEFTRVWPQWHNADAFDRIGEYFERGENDGRETVLRSQPAERAGLYFLVRLNAASVPERGRFVLTVVRPDNSDPKTFEFPIASRPKHPVFELGVTGADWPGGRTAHPVAWQLVLLDDAGHTVAERKSFLWEKPTP